MKLSQVHTMVQFFTHAKFRQDFSSSAAGRAAFVGPGKNTLDLSIEGFSKIIFSKNVSSRISGAGTARVGSTSTGRYRQVHGLNQVLSFFEFGHFSKKWDIF